VTLLASVSLGLVILVQGWVLRDEWRHLAAGARAAPAAELVASLDARPEARVHLLGFPHQDRYGGRLRPLDTWYLGRLDPARLVDHRADPRTLLSLDEREDPPASTSPRDYLLISFRFLPGGRLRGGDLASLAARYELLAWPAPPQGGARPSTGAVPQRLPAGLTVP
jgi:hypothetical protein